MWGNVRALHHLVFEWSVLHRRSPLGTAVPLPEYNHLSLSPIRLLEAPWLGHQPSWKWVSGWWDDITPYPATPLHDATWTFGVLWQEKQLQGRKGIYYSKSRMKTLWEMTCDAQQKWGGCFQARLDFREQDMTAMGLMVASSWMFSHSSISHQLGQLSTNLSL